MTTVLLIEDDTQVRDALRLFLEDEGMAVLEAETGEAGLAMAAQSSPDLVLLDLRLPGIHGLEVCRRLRAASTVPIIIVTAQDDSHDLVAGLEGGADDYVVKPLEPRVLLARIRSLLRRLELDHRPGAGSVAISVGSLVIRPSEGTVVRDGAEVSLTRTEFQLLCGLARHPNQVLSRTQLLEQVWGYDYAGDGRIVDSHIRRLRLKVEADPDAPTFIVTVRGLGYKFSTR